VLPLFEATTVSHAAEWSAGVVLAVLAFTVVFVILAILAASIRLTSKVMEARKGKLIEVKAKPTKALPAPPKAEVKLTPKLLAEAAASIVGIHRQLEEAAAIAAVHHHITSRKSLLPKVYEEHLPQSAWLFSWLTEVTYRYEINPYLKKR